MWAEIAKIPYGEMLTYGEIATALGDPGLARAVGTACNHNPVPVIVPCHRVVGAGGKMVGFGGGIDRKRRLLELEARVRRCAARLGLTVESSGSGGGHATRTREGRPRRSGPSHGSREVSARCRP